MISRLAASSFLHGSRQSRCRTTRLALRASGSCSALHLSSSSQAAAAAATHAHAPPESDALNWFLYAGLVAAASASATTTKTTIAQCQEQEPPLQVGAQVELEPEADASAENEQVMEEILAQERRPDQKEKAKKSWLPKLITGKQGDGDTELPADAYENLPDHDEETDCLLCRTHRQGPCRNKWRKFEHCVKDHSHKDAAKTVCDKFVAPFEECWKQNVNMYILIALDVHQEDVHTLELEYLRRADRRSWATVIDWTSWLDFIRQKGSLPLALEGMATWNSLDRKVPLWQRYEIQEEGDPTVIQASTMVPIEKDGLLLQVVYALDQDDMLIGSSEYDVDYEQQQATKEKRPVSTTHQLAISLLPAMTENLRVFGLYKENPAKADSKKKQLNAVLYESPKVSPQAVAKKAKM